MPPVEIDEPEDIPTIAQGTGIHSSLVAALSQADLVATLQATDHLRYLLQPIRHSLMQE